MINTDFAKRLAEAAVEQAAVEQAAGIRPVHCNSGAACRLAPEELREVLLVSRMSKQVDLAATPGRLDWKKR